MRPQKRETTKLFCWYSVDFVCSVFNNNNTFYKAIKVIKINSDSDSPFPGIKVANQRIFGSERFSSHSRKKALPKNTKKKCRNSIWILKLCATTDNQQPKMFNKNWTSKEKKPIEDNYIHLGYSVLTSASQSQLNGFDTLEWTLFSFWDKLDFNETKKLIFDDLAEFSFLCFGLSSPLFSRSLNASQPIITHFDLFSKCFGIRLMRLMATIGLLHFSILFCTRHFLFVYSSKSKNAHFWFYVIILCIVIEKMVWILGEIKAYRFNIWSTNNQYTTCITVVRSMEWNVSFGLRIVIKDTLPNVVIESGKKEEWTKNMQNEKIATYANRKGHVVFGIQCIACEKRFRPFRFRQNTDKPGIIAMTIGSVSKTDWKMTKKTNGNMYDRCMKGLSHTVQQT